VQATLAIAIRVCAELLYRLVLLPDRAHTCNTTLYCSPCVRSITIIRGSTFRAWVWGI